MSASNTDLEKQQRRHWGPLAGITLALCVAAAAAVFFIGAPAVPNDAADPDGTPAAVEAIAEDTPVTQ